MEVAVANHEPFPVFSTKTLFGVFPIENSIYSLSSILGVDELNELLDAEAYKALITEAIKS